MNRVLVGLLIAAPLSLALASCDEGSWGTGGYGYGYGPAGACGSYTSCGTCTPVDGCGWCSAPNGSGVCASDPDDCPTLEFTWTWNLSGCRVVAEASIEPTDSSSDSTPTVDGATGGDVKVVDGAGADSVAEGGCSRVGDASTCD